MTYCCDNEWAFYIDLDKEPVESKNSDINEEYSGSPLSMSNSDEFDRYIGKIPPIHNTPRLSYPYLLRIASFVMERCINTLSHYYPVMNDDGSYPL